MLEILPFDKNLISDWKYNGTEREFSGEQIIPIVEFYAKLGSCYIGLIDNKVLGIAGVYPLWSSAGGCFLFLNKEAQNYKKSVFKTLLEYMNMLIKQYKIKTLIVECLDDSLQAKNLITHLGFKRNKEIKMASYTKSGE